MWTHLDEPLVARCKLLSKFYTPRGNFCLIMTIGDVDHVVNHAVNYDLNIG